MKAAIGMVCITALGVAKLVIDGDGSVLVACVIAIAALAGVEAGMKFGKKETEG